MVKAMIISLDGGTLDLLGPWMREGLLPNLSTFQQEGVVGRLRSTIPPVTAPAWASFQTGKNPGKHGLFHFTSYRPGSYETFLIDATAIKTRTIWQILSQGGKRVAAINVPITYPPRSLNGIMISGLLSPEPKKAFYPPAFYEELTTAIGEYQIFTPVRSFDYLGVKRFVDRVTHLAQKGTEAALYILGKEDWDLFMVHFQATDILQHALWAYIDPHHPDFAAKKEEDRAYVRGFYRRLDGMIGELIRRWGEGRSLIVFSDHGFGPAWKRLYLNRWLAEEGYLAFKGELWARLIGRAMKVARRMDLFKLRRRLLKPRGRGEGAVERLTGSAWANWSRTQAYTLPGPFFGRLYLNLRGREPQGIVEPEDGDEVREEIIAALYRWRDPRTGQSVIKRALKREEIYSGPYLDCMPDLVVEPADGYMVATELTAGPLIEPTPRVLTGTHRLDGLLMMSGEPFRRGVEVEGISIVDLTPTILYLLGLAIPSDMDGKVLEEGFHPSFRGGNPVRYEEVGEAVLEEEEGVYTEGERAEIEARLSGLGYLD